ncbi:MAG: hypothetical protein ACK5LZ_05910 [Anaerorhabdus sp.]
MKKRNLLLFVLGIAQITVYYALYGYVTQPFVLSLMCVILSIYALSPSKKTLVYTAVHASCVLALEMVLLFLFRVGPSNLLVWIIAISEAISVACWGLIYCKEKSYSRFRIRIIVELMIALFLSFLVLSSLLPESVVTGFRSDLFMSGRQGMIQVSLILLAPFLAEIQYTSLFKLLSIMTIKRSSKVVPTTMFSQAEEDRINY